MGAPGDLPRFPCWCRATYSWGGETKKDLGFIEGDLIEALNAGDGAWWMGRLRRDPRAIGLFPSNFVAVLEESFKPAPNSRNTTPITQPRKQNDSIKGRALFRKPFQAYEELGKRESLDSVKGREGTPDSDMERKKDKSRFRPYSSMKTAQAPTGTIKIQGGAPSILQVEAPRIPDPLPRGGTRRARSPQSSTSPAHPIGHAHSTASRRQSSHENIYEAPILAPARPRSPLPTTFHDGSAYPQMLPPSRQPSPLPYTHDLSTSRSPSPTLFEDDGASSPPPLPPAHRVVYQPSRAPSPQLHDMAPVEYAGAGATTPIPPSPAGSHMTPSPLRAAMNDVMSSLQDMSALQQSTPPRRTETPPNVWSPDAFEDIRNRLRTDHNAQTSLGFVHQGRAKSSLGFIPDHDYNQYQEVIGQQPAVNLSGEETTGVGTYIQRTEYRLRDAPSFSNDRPPAPPPKGPDYQCSRPTTSSSHSSATSSRPRFEQSALTPLRHRKSAFELGREKLQRTYTTKTNATNSTENSSATQSSNSTQMTSRSIMSGYSASGFSATSAGSLARRKFGLGSQRGHMHVKSMGDMTSSARSMIASETSGSGPSYHESHASEQQLLPDHLADWSEDRMEPSGVLGGLTSPQTKRSGFFKRMIATAKTTARTGAASARSTIGHASASRPSSRAGSRAASPVKSMFGGDGPTAIAGGLALRPGTASSSAARDMGLGGGGEWMQVRRDVNRSNSISQRERDDRAERCQMHDLPAIRPIELLHELVEGGESLDGLPITEPTEFDLPNLALVDKSTRFIHNVPLMVSPASLAQSYVCRPHRSDVQRLRAIFVWVAERITWEDDFEGEVDTRRTIQSKRGCSEEIAHLVREMCLAVGLHAEIVRGYLKSPGEVIDVDMLASPNHWWNAVIVDGEWRVMDCALANPSHPKRSSFSTASNQVAETWYFLAQPTEICYTHIPLLPEQQHMVPPVEHEILIALPCACPAYFRNALEMLEFDTSMLHLENLEMSHLHITVPEDIECIAETESRAFAQDADGDLFESGEIVKKRAFAQPEWIGGRKRFTIKAIVTGDDGTAILKVYAGKRGLMHSIKDNPHSLALALPLSHAGHNPPYDFVTRHPTPHAQRHDLYVAQPQCIRLTLNNTFVFCIRQHPSSLARFTPDTWGAGNVTRPSSPNPLVRPGSAMSMISGSVSQSVSQYSDGSSSSGQGMTAAQQKPAKLAIQSPSQKIIRLTRKQENTSRNVEEDLGLTTTWETVIKIGERGTWRGLVLADRSARWCVFAEWECT